MKNKTVVSKYLVATDSLSAVGALHCWERPILDQIKRPYMSYPILNQIKSPYMSYPILDQIKKIVHELSDNRPN